MPIHGSGKSKVGGDNIDLVFQALMDVGNINPRLVADLKNDLEALDKTVEMNAKEFTSTSKDIRKMKQTITRLDGVLKGLEKELPNFAPLQEITREVVAAQNLFIKQIYQNADKIAKNDKAEEERNELLKRMNRMYRRHMSAEELRERFRVRMDYQYRRQEMDYMVKMTQLRQKRSRLMERNLAGFTRDELKSQGDFLNRQQNAKSVISKNVSGIGRNIRRDIPDSSLSRIRVNALSNSANGNLFEQLAGLQTFQQGAQVRKAKQRVERITDIRTTSNPITRMFKLMNHEIKSGQSRLIIKNIANGIVQSLKKQAENALIKILNAPFKAMGFLFRKSKDFIGDITTKLFFGDEALQKRKDDRSIRDEEKRIESQDRNFEMLGVGINDLIDALGKYTSMVSRGGMKDQSINAIEEQMRLAENKFKSMRDFMGFAGDTAETLGYFQNKKIIEDIEELDEHTQENTDAIKKNTKATENVFYVPPGGFGSPRFEMPDIKSLGNGEPTIKKLGNSSNNDVFDSEPIVNAAPNVGQQKEQFLNTFIENVMMQTQIQAEILKILQGRDNGDSSSSKKNKGGIFASILGSLKNVTGGIGSKILAALGIAKLGRMMLPVLKVAKSFMPKIIGALGLGSRRALLGTLTRVLGPITAIVGGFMKTADEFKPNDFLGNVMRLTRNITSFIPQQLGDGLDSIIKLLFGFDLKLRELPDKLFDSLNKVGSFLGDKLHDLIYGNVKEKMEMDSVNEERKRHDIAFENKKRQYYKEKIKKDKANRDEMINKLSNSSDTSYNVNPASRDPFKAPTVSSAMDIDPSIVNDTLPIRVTSATEGKHRKGSKHFTGNALDLTPVGFGGIGYNGQPLSKQNPAAFKAYSQLHKQLESMGLRVVDEYSGPGKTSKFGNARHIHVEGSQTQINDLLNRAQVVKGDVIPFKGVSMKHKAGQMKLQGAMSRVRRSTSDISKSTIVERNNSSPVVNVPPANVNINIEKEMDTSYNGYMMFQSMMG